jgi:hypothetical protein
MNSELHELRQKLLRVVPDVYLENIPRLELGLCDQITDELDV